MATHLASGPRKRRGRRAQEAVNPGQTGSIHHRSGELSRTGCNIGFAVAAIVIALVLGCSRWSGTGKDRPGSYPEAETRTTQSGAKAEHSYSGSGSPGPEPVALADFLRVDKATSSVDNELHKCAALGNADCVRRALVHGANVCSLSPQQQQTVIHTALAQRQSSLATQSSSLPGQYEDIVAMAAGQEAFQDRCSAYQCPVYFAVHYRNMPAMRVLLQASPAEALEVCLREHDTFNRTILHAAATGRASGFARLFIRLLKGSSSHVAYQKTVDNPVLELLNLSTASIVTDSQFKKHSALSHAMLSSAIGHGDMLLLVGTAKRLGILKELLSTADGLGQTVLHVAAAAGRLELVRFLLPLTEGAVISSRDSFGQTPADLAKGGGFHDVAAELAAHGGKTTHRVMGDSGGHPTNREDGEGRPPGLAKAQPRAVSAGNTEKPGETLVGGSANARDTWNTDSGNPSPDSALTCDFDVVSASDFTAELFMEKCIAQRRPLLIKNLASRWPAMQSWKRKTFLHRYGSQRVSVNTVPYGEQYGHMVTQSWMPLETFVTQFMPITAPAVNASDSGDHPTATPITPPYVFDGTVLHRNERLWADVLLPDALRVHEVILRQLIIGPLHSGSPPHFHGLAVNFLIFGQKRWLLTPPATAQFSMRTAAEWFKMHRSASSPPDRASSAGRDQYKACFQGAGDALVVPDSWGHAVMNMKNSIGVAVEFAVTKTNGA